MQGGIEYSCHHFKSPNNRASLLDNSKNQVQTGQASES